MSKKNRKSLKRDSLQVAAPSPITLQRKLMFSAVVVVVLFLGTEKYPDVDEYSTYLRTNGGFSNAYTASDHTNYQLQVLPGAFEGALDRFSQFFIGPLFTEQYTEREVNAVNSEHQKNIMNDGWRQYRI